MASPTITAAEIAVALRAATDADEIPAPIAVTLGFLVPAASAIIAMHAPEAPAAVANAAMIRLCGWLYEADPTDPRIGRALQVSGAAPLLSQWRVHRAAALTAPDTQFSPGGGPVTPGAGLPSLPGDGYFILAVRNGELEWVEFPPPSPS